MLFEDTRKAILTTVYTSPTKNRMKGKELKGTKAYKQKKKGIKKKMIEVETRVSCISISLR
jgi:hypothetical protein